MTIHVHIPEFVINFFIMWFVLGFVIAVRLYIDDQSNGLRWYVTAVFWSPIGLFAVLWEEGIARLRRLLRWWRQR